MIGEGDTEVAHIYSAMKKVRKGIYPLSELRTALISGIEVENRQFQECVDKDEDMYLKSRIKENKLIIRDLRSGKEAVYHGVKIPAQ